MPTDLDAAVRALIEDGRKQKQDLAVHIAECNQGRKRVEEKLEAADASREAQRVKIDENARRVDAGIREIYELLWRIAIAVIGTMFAVISTLVFYMLTHTQQQRDGYTAAQHDHRSGSE